MAVSPRESGRIIAEIAEHVRIRPEGIEKLGQKILVELDSKRLCPGNFSQINFHPKSDDPWAVDWIFVVDTLNFCFWHHTNSPGWKVEGQQGYFALCSAITRAQREGVDITNPLFYSKITADQVSHIFRSDNEVPVAMFKHRLKSLQEVGTVLIKKYMGTFRTCLGLCEGSATKLLKLIIEDFPCFRDEAVYKGHRVGLYKRAQILIADIWSCLKNEGLGNFFDISEITMFADYRIPQTLLYFGAIEYSAELSSVLDAGILLENGSGMEVEIRGVSIHVVELLKDWLTNHSKEKYELNSILIDNFIWDFRRAHDEEFERLNIPFHRTLSIYY